MDVLAIAGITCGLTALLAAGGFAGGFIKVGRTVGRIETEVTSTKSSITALTSTVKSNQDKNDISLENIHASISSCTKVIGDQGAEIANIQGYLNGKNAKSPVRRRRTRKKTE